ncbi:hypothetical protein LLG95_02560 [bacterium]|nr:hypothetical protein [bacterium]
MRWTIGNTSHHGCDALRRDFVGRNARCRKAAGPAAIDFIREHWLRPKPEIEKRIFG